MNRVTGDFSLRVGSVDPKRWRLVQGKNNDPIDLTNAVQVELRMINTVDGTELKFDSTGPSPQFVIFGAPANGEVEFTPAVGDFSAPAEWLFYVDVVDSDGSHPVPERKDNVLTILPKYGA